MSIPWEEDFAHGCHRCSNTEGDGIFVAASHRNHGRDKHPCVLCKNTAPCDRVLTALMPFMWDCCSLIKYIWIKKWFILVGNLLFQLSKDTQASCNAYIICNLISGSLSMTSSLIFCCSESTFYAFYWFYYTIYWYQSLSVPVVVLCFLKQSACFGFPRVVYSFHHWAAVKPSCSRRGEARQPIRCNQEGHGRRPSHGSCVDPPLHPTC